MELRPGHKQTEVGVIPVDWEVKPLGSFAKVTSGKRLPMGYFVGDVVTPYPYIRVTDMRHGCVDTSDVKYVPAEAYLPISKYRIFKEDLFISVAGTLGIVGRIPSELDGANLTENANRISAIECDRDYLLHVMLSPVVQDVIESEQTVGAQPKLALKRIRNFSIPLPPTVREQAAVATALGDVDALLAAHDTLIAKQRAIKRGAMQELLTGKRRLPGPGGSSGFKQTDIGEIPDDWSLKSLRELIDPAHPIRYGIVQPGRYDPSGRYMIRGQDYSAAKGWAASEDVFRVSEAVEFRYKNARVRAGDLIMTIVGYCGHVEQIPDWLDGANLTQTTARISIDHNRANRAFCKYMLSSNFGIRQVSENLKGAAQPGLNIRDVEKFLLPLPESMEEQVAIAETLGDMDAEIAALEAKREKIARLKQGMMQELLTGRIRLVLPATVVAATPAGGKSGGRKANVHFMRSVLAAEIIDQLHNEPTFGHVKFEKLIFLTEHLCKVDTGSHYHRDAAGPYDNRALRSIDSQLKTQKWFEARKLDGRYEYVPLEKHGGHKEYFGRYYASIRPKLDEIIATFRTAKTEQCEIVATLYAAWDDLLKRGKPATDDAIMDQVLNHWHKDKRRIESERWYKALGWMREKSFLPEGTVKA